MACCKSEGRLLALRWEREVRVRWVWPSWSLLSLHGFRTGAPSMRLSPNRTEACQTCERGAVAKHNQTYCDVANSLVSLESKHPGRNLTGLNSECPLTSRIVSHPPTATYSTALYS